MPEKAGRKCRPAGNCASAKKSWKVAEFATAVKAVVINCNIALAIARPSPFHVALQPIAGA
jgi:hypothetical protein